jgi:outer membrane protein assembly factor BamB
MTTPVSPIEFSNTPWLPTVIFNSPITVVAANYGDGILCINGTTPSNGENDIYSWVSNTPYTYFFVNLNASRGAIGSVLWWSTIQPPSNNYTVVPGNVDWNTRMFFLSYKENVQWLGYSLTNGQYVWTAPPQAGLDYYGNPGSGTLTDQIAYGNLYSGGYSGTIYCYNDQTGKLLWTYGNGGAGNSTNAGLNNAYGDYPTQINAVGNGVIYTVTTAHTWTTPIYKGALARAINATTGKEIWTLSGITAEFIATSYAIADGYATWFNGYDNSIYVVGRGPSSTTVQAPQTAITAGNNVIIQGTVMDISNGTTQAEQAADFPHGVPCASDASMSAWMSYVYQQQPCPTNFTGVTVTLTAIDPNNNFITLGQATTDATGHFIFAWQTPAVPGKYTVTATFGGTNGYWGSTAETGMYVQSPATTAPTSSPVTGFASTSTLELGIAALAIIIIVIGAVLAVLMLRKRP